MEHLSQWIQEVTGVGAGAQVKLALSLAAVLGIVLLRRAVLRVVWRRVVDVRARYQWSKLSAYAAFLMTALLVLWIWFRGFVTVTTYFGLVSAGVAIALREPLVDLAGWAFLIWRRPFEVGDRIQVGDLAGDVIDVRLFQFSLLEIGNWVNADQSTGRVVHVPNGRVFSESVANYTKGFQYIWNEIPVLLTFESDWEKAKDILLEISRRNSAARTDEARRQIEQAARELMIFYPTLTPTVYTSVEASGVLLTVRYLCEARQRRSSAEAVWEECLREFAVRDDIDFAYPTQRFVSPPPPTGMEDLDATPSQARA